MPTAQLENINEERSNGSVDDKPAHPFNNTAAFKVSGRRDSESVVSQNSKQRRMSMFSVQTPPSFSFEPKRWFGDRIRHGSKDHGQTYLDRILGINQARGRSDSLS